jgi:SAM-dependent methyltransferase
MAHKGQQDFIQLVRRQFPDFFANRRVLEIGSLDINGSIRSQFTNCTYTGIDVADGPGVDVVCQGQDYSGPEDSFDVVISCEVMEHNPHWAETMKNMIRVCKPGGLVLMTCATLGRGEHGTARTSPDSSPLTVELGWNYYRNLTAGDFKKDHVTEGLSCIFAYNWKSHDLYIVGIKGVASTEAIAKLRAIGSIYRKAFWSHWSAVRRAAKSILLNKRN